jgi:hypothetical protein
MNHDRVIIACWIVTVEDRFLTMDGPAVVWQATTPTKPIIRATTATPKTQVLLPVFFPL